MEITRDLIGKTVVNTKFNITGVVTRLIKSEGSKGIVVESNGHTYIWTDIKKGAETVCNDLKYVQLA